MKETTLKRKCEIRTTKKGIEVSYTFEDSIMMMDFDGREDD